jgi:hypothetical protein
MPHRVQHIWVILALDPLTGDEGVMAHIGPFGSTPLVGSDEIRLKDLLSLARLVKQQTGIDYNVAKFTTRQECPELK